MSVRLTLNFPAFFFTVLRSAVFLLGLSLSHKHAVIGYFLMGLALGLIGK